MFEILGTVNLCFAPPQIGLAPEMGPEIFIHGGSRMAWGLFSGIDAYIVDRLPAGE